MKRLILLVFLFSGSVLYGQNAILNWHDDTQDFISKYNKKAFSAVQIQNCYHLSFDYDRLFTIVNVPNVLTPEDIGYLDLDTLDNEYNQKLNLLKTLDLPKTSYWDSLKNSKMNELEQIYKLSRISYLSFKNPASLRQFRIQDLCLLKHTNALIQGGEFLLKDWLDLVSIRAPKNRCPDCTWKKYKDQLNSKDKFLFAAVYVNTFGWWNCAVEHIQYSIMSFGDKKRNEEFLKLFVKTKLKMENVYDFYDDVD
jgi:hypothetical protein